MDLKFKNITKYSKKVYNEFLKFHTERFFSKYITYTIFIVILLIYLLICNIIGKNWITILIVLLSIILFIIYRIFSQKAIIKREMESNKILDEEEFEYEFYDKFFTIKNKENIEEIKYSLIKKCYETKGYFYLYIDNSNAFIINKEGFIQGNIEDYKKFIALKCRFARKNSK